MLSRTELRHVRSFLSLAKTLNFSRTAEIVHPSQPALSLQIQSLEEGPLDLGFLWMPFASGPSFSVTLIHHGPLQSREMTESDEAPLVYSI